MSSPFQQIPAMKAQLYRLSSVDAYAIVVNRIAEKFRQVRYWMRAFVGHVPALIVSLISMLCIVKYVCTDEGWHRTQRRLRRLLSASFVSCCIARYHDDGSLSSDRHMPPINSSPISPFEWLQRQSFDLQRCQSLSQCETRHVHVIAVDL